MSFEARNLNELVSAFNTYEQTIKPVLTGVMKKFTMDIFNGVRRRSPVDKGIFRGNWGITEASVPGTLYASRIFNNMPYAEPLVYGSPVGGYPWPSAGIKTVIRKNRVYSKQAAPPDTVFPEMNETDMQAIAEGLVNAVLQTVIIK